VKVPVVKSNIPQEIQTVVKQLVREINATQDQVLSRVKGDKGDKGDTGDTGPQGAKGETGNIIQQVGIPTPGPAGPQGLMGFTGPQGSQGPAGTSYQETFETVAQNLNSSGATLNYTGGKLMSIVYTNGITKTINYSGNNISSVVLSGSTPGGISLTKTISYTVGDITGVSYS